MPIRFEVQDVSVMGSYANGKLIVQSSEKKEAKEINLQFVGMVTGVDANFNFFLHKEVILQTSNQQIEFCLEIPFVWKIPLERASSVLEWPNVIWALFAQVKWSDSETDMETQVHLLRLNYSEDPPPQLQDVIHKLTEERRKASEWDVWDKKDLDRTFAFVAMILFFIFGSHFVCRPEGMNLGFQWVGVSVTISFALCIGIVFINIRRIKTYIENFILFLNGISINKDVSIFALPESKIPWKIPRFSSWSLVYQRRIIEFHKGMHRGDQKTIEDRRTVTVEIQSGKVEKEERNVILEFPSYLPSQIFVPHRHLYYILKIEWKPNFFRGIFWKIVREVPVVFGYWKNK